MTVRPHAASAWLLLCPARISPPQVLLAGCGTCLQVRVAMPGEGDAAAVDIHKRYRPDYSVLIRRRAEQVSAGLAGAAANPAANPAPC